MCDRDILDDSDDLAGMFGGKTSTTPINRAPETYTPAAERFNEPCSKCRGSGQWRPGYPCFACKGTGRLTFKTSPDKRATARAHRAEKAATKAADAAAWRTEHKAELDWLHVVANREEDKMGMPPFKFWEFPVKLRESLAQYSTLTDGQLAAVRTCMTRDAERATQKAAERETNAAEVSIAKIEDALTSAHANGKRKPFLLLDAFKFTRAPDGGKNPGAIYVTEGDDYLGKVQGGKLNCTRTCTEDQKAKVIEAAANPEAAAIAYGKRTGQCSCCGAGLTNPESIELGIGPICREKYGW